MARGAYRGLRVEPRAGSAASTVIAATLTTLDGDVTRHDGIAITTAARTLIDLSAQLKPVETARAFREALRLKTTTIRQLDATLRRHRGRRGTGLVRELTARYAGIPYARTRSDAEARALEVLLDSGAELPHVNMRIAGEEADLVLPGQRRIIEIDGPQFHMFRDEDERKAAIWRRAGYTVDRVPSDVVYNDPAQLIRLAR